MLVVIPLLAWFFLFQVVSGGGAVCRRESFLRASLIWGLLVTVITECLSRYKILTSDILTVVWLLIVLLLALLYREQITGKPDCTIRREKMPAVFLICRCGVTLIILTTGLIALASPPNNWDSMTYHLGRVMHWIQNCSVEHYPTHIMRQLYMNPWAEFAIMHLQILSRGDGLVNLVQWFSLVGSIVGVSLIAGKLGGKPQEQWFAGLIAAAVPMGVLQASSTQNDLVVTFWLVCLVYYTLSAVLPDKKSEKPEQERITIALWLGLSLGLAVLTKGTAYVYALPFSVWFAWAMIRRFKIKSWPLLIWPFLIFLGLNSGHYLRNYSLFGDPLFIPVYEGVRNEIIGPGSLISNLLRNTGLNIGTPFPWINQLTEKAIYALHGYLGISPGDPRTTFNALPFHIVTGSFNNENNAGSPLHLILLWLTLLITVGSRKMYRHRKLMFYILALSLAFLLFCLLIKWQPWGTRLHLPLLVLAAPYLAIALFQILSFNRRVIAALSLCIILSALPWLFGNQTRPLIASINPEKKSLEFRSVITTPREEQYFADRPHIREAYKEVTRHLAAQGYPVIGIISSGDAWEYPIWVLVNDLMEEPVRIEHVQITNESRALELTGFDPPCIVHIFNQPVSGVKQDENFMPNHSYHLSWQNEYFLVYTR